MARGRMSPEEARLRQLEASRKWKWQNVDRVRAYRKTIKRSYDTQKASFIKSTYGITITDYYEMLQFQNELCAICGKPETRKNKYTGTCRLHIDHDHKTGKVRGLLCSKCNVVLGAFGDNIEILMSAINYLRQ